MALSAQIENQGWFVFSDSETPPDTTANWKPVVLPDSWGVTRPGMGGNSWYHFRLHFREKPAEMQALLIDRVSMNAACFVGEHFLGDGGSFDDPVSRNWVRPLLFKIPVMYLDAGDNDVFIRVYSYASDIGGLDQIHQGSYREMKPLYESLFSYYILSSQTTFYMQLALSLLLFSFWLFRKQEAVFLWLSASGLMGALFSLNMFVRDIPIPQPAWEWGVQVSIGWFVWFVFLFIHRYLDIDRVWLERIVAAYAIGGASVLLFLPISELMFGGTVWQGGFEVIAIYIYYVSVRGWWKTRSLGHLAWLFAITLLFLTGVNDWISILLRQIYGLNSHLMFHLGTSVLVLVASAVLLSRFLQALNHLEISNQQLVGKVDSFKAKEEQRLAVLDERRRIMRDLHDGLGNSLVSAMALSMGSQNDRPELQGVLQEAMSEMRLIVGSSTTADFDFEKALMLVKERARLTLLASDIEFHWQTEKLLSMQRLQDSVAGMHVVRILQEALTNAIKHAKASKIGVTAVLDDEILQLCISDDGQGLSDSNGGNGFKSMRARAEEIDAPLSIHSDTSGTRLTLLLPLA